MAETTKLPPAAAKALARIPKASKEDKSDLAFEALEAVSYPKDRGVPLPATLDPAQREVVIALAPMRDVWLGGWPIPQPSWSRMRWLGLAPAGVLERPAKAPLWKKLNEAGMEGSEEVLAAFAALKLPLLDRLEVFADIALSAYPRLYATWNDLGALRGAEVGAWAKRQADRAAAALASKDNDRIIHIREGFGLAILLGLARAGIPFEERWSGIVDPFDGPKRERIEAFAGIAEPLRSRILAERIAKNVYTNAVMTGVELLPHFPTAALAQVVLDKSDKASRSKASIVAEVAKIAAKHSAVQEVLDRFKGKEPKPLVLILGKTVRPKNIAALDDVQRAQVTAMFDSWEGDQKTLAARFPKGKDDFGEMGLMLREVLDANKKRAYDAVSFNADDGQVFVARTTRSVAQLVQHEVSCGDRRLYDALRETLLVDVKPKTKPKAKARKPVSRRRAAAPR